MSFRSTHLSAFGVSPRSGHRRLPRCSRRMRCPGTRGNVVAELVEGFGIRIPDKLEISPGTERMDSTICRKSPRNSLPPPGWSRSRRTNHRRTPSRAANRCAIRRRRPGSAPEPRSSCRRDRRHRSPACLEGLRTVSWGLWAHRATGCRECRTNRSGGSTQVRLPIRPCRPKSCWTANSPRRWSDRFASPRQKKRSRQDLPHSRRHPLWRDGVGGPFPDVEAVAISPPIAMRAQMTTPMTGLRQLSLTCPRRNAEMRPGDSRRPARSGCGGVRPRRGGCFLWPHCEPGRKRAEGEGSPQDARPTPAAQCGYPSAGRTLASAVGDGRVGLPSREM